MCSHPVDVWASQLPFLDELSKKFVFDYTFVEFKETSRGRKERYTISETLYARKKDLDEMILNGTESTPQGRAAVLYSLYACRHLEIVDIKYKTYQSWKNVHPCRSTLDHILPKSWFPELTFDCNNWEPKSMDDNQKKGNDFLEEAVNILHQMDTSFTPVTLF